MSGYRYSHGPEEDVQFDWKMVALSWAIVLFLLAVVIGTIYGTARLLVVIFGRWFT